MNKRLKEIIGFFSLEKIRNDRRIVVFMVCVLIATVLWFLNALSQDYSTTVSYSVKYTNPPGKLFLANNPPSKIDLKVDAHGFTLLRHKLSFSYSPIVLDLTSIAKDGEQEGNLINVRTEDLIRLVSQQVSSEIKVTDISPKIITLLFDSLYTKSIPLKADVNIDLKPQFFLTGSVIVEPDSVQITGPAAIIDTVNIVKTKTVNFEKLGNEVELAVDIVHPDKTTVSPEKANLKIPVERFTEKEFKIPLEIRNKPEDINFKIFPSEVSISFLIGLNNYEDIRSTDFQLFVDYDSINTSETLEVYVSKKPDFIQLLRISPPSVEYLIETE